MVDVPRSARAAWLKTAAAWLLGGASLLTATPAASQANPILPSGERIDAGAVTITRDGGSTLTVAQTSPTAIIRWSDFSIGNGGTARFDNGSGATLNRVDGAAPSRIDGALNATGSVYLVNPRGVIVGRQGVVQVGGSFVASTLDTDDAAFLTGGDTTFTGGSRAAVVNLGRIGALGGDVALIATQVRNEGTITAAAGTAALLTGTSVLVRDAGSGFARFAVLVGDADTSATNTGALRAATAAIQAAGGSIYALAGNLDGVVAADTIGGADGQVLLTAGEGGSVSVGSARLRSGTPTYGGTITITGERIDIAPGAVLDVSGAGIGGLIDVEATGTLRFAGTALARGADQGGSVWTFGRSVDAGGATVDTRGAAVGEWILLQPNVTIDAGLAGLITRALRTTNIQVAANGAVFGDDPAVGALTVAAPLNIAGGNRLTLLAANVLQIDQNVTVGGGSVLSLFNFGGEDGVPVRFAPNRSITFTGPPRSDAALLINDDVYTLIYDVAGLQGMQADPAGFYALARTFSAGGTVLSGAAVGAQGSEAFSGRFDGLGHSINGLRIDAPGRSQVGLFGAVGGGSIRNVTLQGGSVVGGSSVGALVGRLTDGTIVDAHSSAAVSARGDATSVSIGGLVGAVNFGSVIDSSASGTVSAAGATYVGGLAGYLYGSVIDRSFATGAVTGGEGTGGLVGELARAGATNSYATGAVTGTRMVGGVVGSVAFGSSSGSRGSGRVVGDDMVGGYAGFAISGYLTGVSASGAVVARTGRGGGLVGFMNDTGVDTAFATGRVSGGTAIGGLIGGMDSSYLADVAARGAVAATGDGAGGLVGTISVGAASSTILRSTASGDVRGADGVGGLVGIAPGLTLDASSASGNVRGLRSVGGLIGGAGARYGIYSNVVASGEVSGNSFVGGLIGSTDNVQISGARATGRVTGSADGSGVGGLVGSLFASSIVDSEASGRVAGGRDVGGLVGASFASRLQAVTATGTVNGTLGAGENVGGLIGRSEIDDIADARARNAVRGRVNVGGLIGRRTGGTLANVAATGPVTGARNVGPLIGRDDPAP